MYYLDHSTARKGTDDGHIPLTQATEDITEISEYLDFGFYAQVQFKYNTGTSQFETADGQVSHIEQLG